MHKIEWSWFVPVEGEGTHVGTYYAESPPDIDSMIDIIQTAENVGFDTVLIQTGLTNNIFAEDAPIFDDITATAILAKFTNRIRLLMAVKTGEIHPALLAKMCATIDQISNGRLAINVTTGSGSIESKFYAELLELTGFEDPEHEGHMDRARWPEQKVRMTEIFKTKTRDEWCEILEGTDVCFAPVLTLTEAPKHPHNVSRDSFVEVAGATHPAPAPRFSRTPSQIQKPASAHGADTEAVLKDWGFSPDVVGTLKSKGVVS